MDFNRYLETNLTSDNHWVNHKIAEWKQHGGISATLKTDDFTLENRFLNLDLYRITSALLDGIE